MRTLSRFALIGMIGGGTAACSSDASRLGDPFTNPFSSLTGEPSATGSLPEEGSEAMTPAPAIRTPRVQSQALPAPALSPRPTAIGPSPTPAASRVASAEPLGAVAGMNPDAGRAMTPRASAPAPAPKLQFGKPVDRAAEKAAAEKKAAEAAAAKAAERAAEKAAETKREAERQAAAVKAAEAKIAEAKAAERAAAAKAAESKKLADVKKAVEAKKAAEAEAKKAEAKLADAKKHVRPGQTAKVEPKVEAKAEAKPDPKAEARKSAEAEAARKAEAEARQAKADAAKKLAEARAAEAAAKAAAAKEAKETKQAAAPAPAVKVASLEPTAPVAAPAAAPAAPAAPAAEAFRWPAKGRIINGYGSGGNEGINIAVPEGTPVKAAEDGTVAYAGSDVKGYGKLVLVRHNNGYVSAYAHNGELDVRPGEKVRRGQTIAKSGATGNVTSPQLHFEIRKGATPVDPIPHLASN